MLPEIPTICPKCGASTKVAVGQDIFSNKLVWWAAINCESCGYSIEEDGGDLPPPEYRNAILKSQGTWELRIDSTENVASVARCLRRIFSLSLESAMAAAKRIPGAVTSGTKVEMKHAVQLLAAENITASSTQV